MALLRFGYSELPITPDLEVPPECFAQLGVRLRARFPGVPLIIATDTNGAAGYVPTSEAFAAGGYEIDQARSEGIPPDMPSRLEERIAGWIA